jgi:hypothetical protein
MKRNKIYCWHIFILAKDKVGKQALHFLKYIFFSATNFSEYGQLDNDDDDDNNNMPPWETADKFTIFLNGENIILNNAEPGW